ncbi:porin [Moraxella sp. ZJ142]|uniref:porin n=1 Tax=Moraxella marmotae TaxID=3344520 RepID=UPI0035D3FB3B
MHKPSHPPHLHPLARQLCWAISASALALAVMPAHAMYLQIPSVKNGLTLGIYGTVNPEFSTRSNKFNYTYGDPEIFGENGSIADVLANQDRKDSDEQLRLDGLNTGTIQFYASQKLTPKITANSSLVVEARENSASNWGAYWGVGFDFGSFGELGSINIGGYNNGLGVSQTGLGLLNTLNDSGTNINASYTGIPNLTLSAYHMLTQSADINDNKDTGWHHSDGASAKYEFDFAPRKTLTLAGGYARSKGHDSSYYYDAAQKADAYLLGVGFNYNNWKVDLDYGKRQETYNGVATSGIDKTTYGAKLNYEFTPRLKGTLSYGRSNSKNDRPADFAKLLDLNAGLEPYSSAEAVVFNRVKKERYSAGLQYKLYKGVTLNGTVSDLRSTNYITEGEFSNRKQLTTNVGVSFSF